MTSMQIRIKTVKYQCGCEVVLRKWGEVEAPLTCPKHFKGILSIVEKTDFIDLSSDIWRENIKPEPKRRTCGGVS